MTAPQSAADLRLVPHYIAPCCPTCGSRLVLADRALVGRPEALNPPDDYEGPCVWWDEWECIQPECLARHEVFMDWPAELVEMLTAASVPTGR